MSDYERIRGRIILEPRTGNNESNKNYFERVTKTNYQKYNYEPDTLQEAIYDNDLEKKFIELDGNLYSFLYYDQLPNVFDFCTITKNKGDASLNFECCFYNGGANLSEVLEEGLRCQEQ